MSAWGYALFSDDTACDVRGDYRELIEDGVEDAEATQKILADYAEALDDPDDGPIVWLALAASQSKIGRLEPSVLTKALEVLDQGLGLDRWAEEGPKELAKRRAALGKVRAQLIGPQPGRKKLRRPWRYVTDLAPGNVLTYRSKSRNNVLLRVAQVDDDRVSAAPHLVLLDYLGDSVPSGKVIEQLDDGSHRAHRDNRELHIQQAWDIFRVAKYRKKDPDYGDAGFELLDTVVRRPGDASVEARTHLGWSQLATLLDRRT